DFCLDVHGDEGLPYNFTMDGTGVPNYSDHQKRLYRQFNDALLAASPDYHTKHGYPRSAPGQANLTMCTPWVAERFDCLSMTLEMPFKDNADLPDKTYGWSPARCKLLGRSCLDALGQVADALR
ncbi:MAG: hypothetical protein AAF449_21090, partial [Myxococcota bacterium]